MNFKILKILNYKSNQLFFNTINQILSCIIKIIYDFNSVEQKPLTDYSA